MKSILMKRYTIAIILAFTMMSFIEISPSMAKKDRFVIKGNIKGLRDGTWLFLIQHSTKDTIARTKAQHEQFVLQGRVSKGTEYFYIRLDTAVSKQRSQEMLLVNNDLTLNGNIADWPKIQLIGSTPHNEYLDFVALWDNFKKPIIEAKKHFSKSPDKRDSLLKEIKLHEQRLLANTKAFINAHANSYYVADIVARMEGDFSYEEMEKMYNNLTPEAKTSYFGSVLKVNLDIASTREKVKPGSIIPDFNINAISQPPTTMHQLASQNKLTLIDFWASWCGACRKQFPAIKKVYEEFNSRGFSVIGIALNDKDEDWKKALMKDNTPWLNMRDSNNKLYNLFSVSQIPAYILVDQKGKLISFYCTGSSIANFGPSIKDGQLYTTVDSLLRKS